MTDEPSFLSISDSVAGYAQSYDSRDHDGLEAVLDEHCTVTMRGGRFDGDAYDGRPAVVEWLEETWPQTPPCLHLTGNLRTWSDSSGQGGSTDYVFVGRQPDGTIRLAGAGRYADRFVRHGEDWVIEERVVEMLGHGHPATPPS